MDVRYIKACTDQCACIERHWILPLQSWERMSGIAIKVLGIFYLIWIKTLFLFDSDFGSYNAHF